MQFFIFLYFFLSFVKLNSDASIHFTYVAKNHFKLKIFLFPSLSSSPPRNRPYMTHPVDRASSELFGLATY